MASSMRLRNVERRSPSNRGATHFVRLRREAPVALFLRGESTVSADAREGEEAGGSMGSSKPGPM